MSLQYLLDGYNIIHQIPQLSKGDLDQQRLALIRYLEVRRPQGGIRNQVTIVFDGKPGMHGCPSSSAVQCVFSQSESADDRIKKMVERAGNPKQYVIVTNDREIQYAVKANGAKVLSVQEFFKREHGQRSQKIRGDSKETKKRYVPKNQEMAINEELLDVWVKKKKGAGGKGHGS
ncbi:MAG: NYN domain-containing protein [Candidatus Omnitrophica bacterium]|nr:NYN domain-containing protein [Candidatus Omnitrophota bacterium]